MLVLSGPVTGRFPAENCDPLPPPNRIPQHTVVRSFADTFPGTGSGVGASGVCRSAPCPLRGDRPGARSLGVQHGQSFSHLGEVGAQSRVASFCRRGRGTVTFLEAGADPCKRLPSWSHVPPALLPASMGPQPPWARHPLFLPGWWLVGRGQWRPRVPGEAWTQQSCHTSVPGKPVLSHPQRLPSLLTFVLGVVTPGGGRVGGVPTRLGMRQSCVDLNSS